MYHLIMPIKVLIVIITHGRFKCLDLCLESLARSLQKVASQKKYTFTVLLGLNGIEAPIWLSNHEISKSDSFQILKIKNHLSPPAARNVLMKSMTSDYTVFFDDDVIIPESYLVDLCDLISQHPDLQVLGGPNLSPPQATLFERASGLALASTWGTSAISSRYSLRKDSFFTRSELPFALCNLCIKNENQDLFHKDLKYGEETDLLQRLFKDSKCLGLYSPQLFVWHFRRPTWSSFMIQMFKYGLGRGLTLKEASSNRKLQFLGLVGLYLFLAIILLLHPVLLLSVLILISILSLMTAPKPFDIKLWFYLSLSLIFIYALYPLGVIVGAIRRFFPSIEEHP
ncbi:MAG TPA: glycosyltransferase family 2 protein [Bdellovibrio sp.]|uniref:glycosyltransferase family 2 protein n=1 Tax=Bdellovibrio sp. TaxID=28201 RepID=UPI002F07698D